MNTKPILAFDCACVGGSVALHVGGVSHTHLLGQTKEAAELIPAIDALMKAHGVAYSALAAIITTVGPGSFTGVRIGLAALHGLALAHPTTIKTLTTLEAMAWAVTQNANAPRDFYIALRAGKGEVYAQKFQLSGNTPSASSDITLVPETFTAWDAPCYGNHLNAEDACFIHGPEAAVLCAIAQHLPTTTLAEAMPLYIRPPDAIAAAPYAWLQAK
jgi:tRNA threonylcarbamoyladenosine biosynthesis protein TsaB